MPGLPSILPLTNPTSGGGGGGGGPPPSPPAAIPGLANAVAEYYIRVRDGTTLNLVGELRQPLQALFVRNHNKVGTWAIEIDADDPMAPYLAADKAGIQVLRVLRDPLSGVNLSTTILFSGPRWSRVRQMAGNKLQASGYDDLSSLQGRIAYQYTGSPNYGTYIGTLSGLVRYWKLDENVGAGTASDSSGSAVTATYSGSRITGATELVDSAGKCTDFEGGYASFSTSGLPTGNAPWSVMGWGSLALLPAVGGARYLVSFGGTTAGTFIGLGVKNVAGVLFPYLNVLGTDVLSGTAISLGITHFYAGTWDGTTATLFVDGVAVATATPGALALTESVGTIAGDSTRTLNWNNYVDEVAIGTSVWTPTQLQFVYALGLSRLANAEADVRSGQAESVIRAYVDANCVSAGNDALGLPRAVPFLQLAADGGQGSAVTGTARGDQLLTPDGTGLLQVLALNGNMGLEVVQDNTNHLIFQQYVPNDLTNDVIFSVDFGNLADFVYQENGPDFTQGGNVVLVGGGGQGTQRLFVARYDSSSLVRWGRFEGYVDARDTSDRETLQQRGDATLAQIAAQTQVSIVLAPQRGIIYGLDFDLGDMVTVVIDGVLYQDIVRSIEIELSPQGAETVTPMIGTPSAEIVNQLFGGFVQRKQLSQLRDTVSRLARST